MYSNTSAAKRTTKKKLMTTRGAARFALPGSGQRRMRADRRWNGPASHEAGYNTVRAKAPNRPEKSRVLQHDLDDDVAGIAAAVDRLFHHLVELLQDDELLGVVGAVIELLQQREHDLVRLALGVLQPVVR